MAKKGKRKRATQNQPRRREQWTALQRPERQTSGADTRGHGGQPGDGRGRSDNRGGGQGGGNRDRGQQQGQGGQDMWVNPYYFVGHTSVTDDHPGTPWWATAEWEAATDQWKPVPHDRQREGCLSGWIDLEVTTKGYLSFADPERTWRYQCGNGTHRVSDFFTVNGHLVIPGSELRGMIRTNLEAVLDTRAAILDEPPAGWEGRERCTYRLVTGTPLYAREPGILDIDTNRNTGTIRPCRVAKIPAEAFEDAWQAAGRQLNDMHGSRIEVKTQWLHRRSTLSKSGEVVREFKFPGQPAAAAVRLLTVRGNATTANGTIRLVSGGKVRVNNYHGPELDGTNLRNGQTVTATIQSYRPSRNGLNHHNQRIIRMVGNNNTWDSIANAVGGTTWQPGYVYVPRDIDPRVPDRPRNPVSRYILVFIERNNQAQLNVGGGVLGAAREADEHFDFQQRRFTRHGGAAGQSLFVRYWEQNGQVRQLGAVGVFKWPEERSWKQIVDEDKSLRPANTEEEFDPVSRLFGWIPGDEGAKDQGFMGRLSFEPLTGPEASDQSLTEWRTLPIRGQPKPQYYPFYLQGDGGGLGRYSETTSRLRGRKFYWHFPEQKRGDLPGLTPENQDRVTNQNATERLCRPGQPFHGRVYFSNLEPWELGALLWTMTFSADPLQPSQAHGHHLGGGAATGFGSVQFRVKGIHTVDHAREWDGLTENGIADARGSAAGWVMCFLTKIGPSIGLNAQGKAAEPGSPIWDWLKGHELEALADWPSDALGYRQGRTEGGELQAPAYYMQMRGRRRDACVGTEEPMVSVRAIALEHLGQEVVPERH